MSVKVYTATFNPLGENTYVVADEDARQCVIVDPGMSSSEERDAVDSFLTVSGLTITAIWLTHMHFDHVWGVKHLVDKYGVPVCASSDDVWLMEGNVRMTQSWGLEPPEPFSLSLDVADGQVLTVGHSSFVAIATPGHSPGGTCYYSAADKICFSGDTLFRMSVGRTDFERGDADALLSSVNSKLFVLPDDTVVYTGHGQPTTIADERRMNPYVITVK